MTKQLSAPASYKEMRRPVFQALLSISILTAVAVHIYLYQSGFYSISADECGRTMEAYDWFKNGRLGPSPWLPFYRLVVGLGLMAWPDLFVTPRIVGFLFGLISFRKPFYKMVLDGSPAVTRIKDVGDWSMYVPAR